VIKLAEYPLSYHIVNSLEHEFFENSDHGYRHSLDLVLSAEKMILKYDFKVDYEVLLTAIYLHDVYAECGVKHGHLAVELFNDKFSALFTPLQVKKIQEAIRYHDDKSLESREKRKSHYLESQLLYDLDNIDAFGVKGVYRYIKVYHSRGVECDAVAEMVASNIENRFETLCFESSKEWCREDFHYALHFFKKASEKSRFEEAILRYIYKRADIPIERVCKTSENSQEFLYLEQDEHKKCVKFFDTLYQIYNREETHD